MRPTKRVAQPATGQYSGGFGAVPGMAGNVPHASYEQVKKAEERKKALELAAIRREDAIADAAWKQRQKEEQRAQQVSVFKSLRTRGDGDHCSYALEISYPPHFHVSTSTFLKLREFRHNEFLSKAGAARKKKEESLAANEKRMLARNQTASFVFLRDQKNAYDNDEEKLANNKIQFEVTAQLRWVCTSFSERALVLASSHKTQ